MDTIVIDTDILINHIRGKSKLLSEFLLRQKAREVILVVPSVVIFEFYSGSSLDRAEVVEIADLLFSQLKVQDITEEIAKVAAQINRQFKLYQKIETVDILIAAVCLSLSGKLLTRNKRHFKLVPQIDFIN
jgi:predicted nucleic acid-binding protein